jgi:hypothetical protein
LKEGSMNNLNLKKPRMNNHKQNLQNCYWLGQKHHTGFSAFPETKGGSHE